MTNDIQSAKSQALFFEGLYLQYRDTIYNYVYLLVQSSYAEEITQEIFIKMWTIKDSWDAIQNFESYLYAIARNQTLNYLRRRNLEENALMNVSYHIPFASFTTEETIGYNESKKLVAQAVEKLPPQRKLIYRLSKEMGLKRPEIAKLMGLSIYTVKEQLRKARNNVKTDILWVQGTNVTIKSF